MEKNNESSSSGTTLSLPPPVIPDSDRESVWRLLWYLLIRFSWNSQAGLSHGIMQKLQNPGMSNRKFCVFQNAGMRHNGDSPEFRDRNDGQKKGFGRRISLSRTHAKDPTEKSVKSINPCPSVIQTIFDIVKAHGRKTNCQFSAREGTEFIIQLPG